MRAVRAAARAAVSRRRLQSLIVGMVVLLSTATGVIALGLLIVSHTPFDTAFATARGAHVTATITATTPDAALTATATATGVTAAAGPFEEVTVAMTRFGGGHFPPATIVGRSLAAGPVDRLALDSGTWLTGPGQVVLARDYAGPVIQVGDQLTVATPGGPTLRVVGIADSVTGSADAWVWPGQADVLHATGAPVAKQMLYRFASNGSVAALRTSFDRAVAGLPSGAVTGSTNYLSVRAAANRSVAAFVPFVVAFAVLGIILSVLITANVVNGAVVSGYRVIGVLKTLGFTPRQVVAVYVTQVVVPSVIGCLAGVGLGVLLATPLLAQTDRAYNLPESLGGLPIWIMVVVPAAALVLVASAAIGPASRAGRLAANQAISLGRAPRAGRGFRLRRALTATRLPRSIALGAGMPLARPARAAGTVVALVLGAVTLVFAVGLTTSLDRINTAFTRVDAVPVEVPAPVSVQRPDVGPDPGGPPKPIDVAATEAVIDAQPGTAHSSLVEDDSVHVSGFGRPVTVEAYARDAGWTGFAMISGRWYAGPNEVVASSYLLRQSGHRVGDRITVIGATGQRTVTVTGEFMDGSNNFNLIAGAATMQGVGTPNDDRPRLIEIGLKPGTDVAAYVRALQAKFPISTGVFINDRTQDNDEATFLVLYALIGTLTLLLCGVAALGVLNTVVLNTRERIHDIGVLKALGMTPGQVRGMVVTSMIGIGVFGGLIAVPLGVALHHEILPAMISAAGEGIAPPIVHVYGAAELAALGAAGVLLAVLGALLPAGWAARTRVATALRAE